MPEFAEFADLASPGRRGVGIGLDGRPRPGPAPTSRLTKAGVGGSGDAATGSAPEHLFESPRWRITRWECRLASHSGPSS
jgi:hypothetical protein